MDAKTQEWLRRAYRVAVVKGGNNYVFNTNSFVHAVWLCVFYALRGRRVWIYKNTGVLTSDQMIDRLR